MFRETIPRPFVHEINSPPRGDNTFLPGKHTLPLPADPSISYLSFARLDRRVEQSDTKGDCQSVPEGG